jgi:uncharacterized protein
VRGPRGLLAAFHQAMVSKSAGELADLHAEDAVYELPLPVPGRPERYTNREQIRRGFGAARAAPVDVERITDVVVHETADPGVIIAEQRAAARVIKTGRPSA